MVDIRELLFVLLFAVGGKLRNDCQVSGSVSHDPPASNFSTVVSLTYTTTVSLTTTSALEMEFEIAFSGPCGPLIKINKENRSLFWRCFRKILEDNLGIPFDHVTPGKLLTCGPIWVSFNISQTLRKQDDILNEIKRLIRQNIFNVHVPGVTSVYKAIEVRYVDKTNKLKGPSSERIVLVVFIVCGGSMIATVINIVICHFWTKRRFRLRTISTPNGHPAVTYSMDEVLKSWERRKRSKQGEAENAKGDTPEADQGNQPIHQGTSGAAVLMQHEKHEKQPRPVPKKPPPLVLPIGKETA